jgi:hypothetical protein
MQVGDCSHLFTGKECRRSAVVFGVFKSRSGSYSSDVHIGPRRIPDRISTMFMDQHIGRPSWMRMGMERWTGFMRR